MATTQKLFFTLLLCSSIYLLIITGSEGAPSKYHHHGNHHEGGGFGPKKLFAFGDSYADTGNSRLSQSSAWKVPYGITFPGKPSGRFSDGRISTDFLARYLGLKSPLPYRWRKHTPQNTKYGINFAFGGTGVFDTPAPYPNMTTQIDLFQDLVKENMFTTWDLQNAIALVSLAGNDYSAYLAIGGTAQGLQAFIKPVVNQLVLNIQRIYSLGVKKIAVTALPPLGCLPTNTVTKGFEQCNTTFNQATMFHNMLLQQLVAKLNNQTLDHDASNFIIIDFYNAFSSVLQQNGAQQGSSRFDSLLKPCCMGVNQNYSCGSVDIEGNKMYTVCQNPKSSFFWDSVHPTEAGWHAVYLNMQANLDELHSN